MISVDTPPRRLTWLLALLLPLLWAAGASAQSPKRIGVMLFEGVLSSDVTAPLEVFGNAITSKALEGYQVVTIAPRAGVITTHEGLKLVADYGIDDAPELDVLLVGSRYDMDSLLGDQAFMRFMRERGRRATWLASNCSGAYVLARAGFLDGKKATTYPGGEVWLKLNHPRVDIEMNRTVVVDGNVVTSNGSMVSYEAALELLRQIAGERASRQVADNIYFTRLVQRAGRR